MVPSAPTKGNTPAPSAGGGTPGRTVAGPAETVAGPAEWRTGRVSLLLATVPFPSIDDPVKLTRVIQASLLLRADLDLPVLLSHVMEEARALTAARYGVLGILDGGRSCMAEYVTVGITQEESEKIGPGLTEQELHSLLGEPEAPVGTPPARSVLTVPIDVRNEVYGSIHLVEKIGSPRFTVEDEALVEALAVAAGMAIENARLHQRLQQVAITEGRDRMARDLHDTVVQHLYAVGITLETMARDPEATGLADRLTALVSDIGEAIRHVRSSIYELGHDEEDPGLRAGVLTLVRSLDPMLGFDARVSFDGPVDSVISQSVTEQLLATIREAVTNVGRHARATTASVTVSAHRGMCRLRVTDDGIGLDASGGAGGGGLGLFNLRRRAEIMHGSMEVGDADTGGTVLVWEVPISQ